MKEFMSLLLCGVAPMMFFVFLIYAYMGLFTNFLVDILSRDSESINSPTNFSWKYWWLDNRSRFWISIILIPILVVLWKLVIGSELNNLNAFMIGWTGDAITNLLKKRGIISNGDKK